jgi:hypothetical protein
MTEREHQTMRKFRRGDIPAVVLAIVLGTYWLYTYFKRPDWHAPSGFGSEWQCTGPGARSAAPDFCIKKPPVDPANQTTPPN